jgi:hypothetical protein
MPGCAKRISRALDATYPNNYPPLAWQRDCPSPKSGLVKIKLGGNSISAEQVFCFAFKDANSLGGDMRRAAVLDVAKAVRSATTMTERDVPGVWMRHTFLHQVILLDLGSAHFDLAIRLAMRSSFRGFLRYVSSSADEFRQRSARFRAARAYRISSIPRRDS